MLGLPDGVTALLFDLDGVLTDTASVHKAAWKEMFDAYLADRGEEPFTDSDYERYVDGKPRYDGVRSFLQSRGIDPEQGLVRELGDRKNELVLKKIHEDGVKAYDGSRRYLEAARDAGLRRAVCSSSANAADVLHVTGLEELIEERVDGKTLGELGL